MAVGLYRFLAIASGLACISAAPIALSESYTNALELNVNYNLYWKYSGVKPSDVITFEAHVRTLGWIGLGISPQGAMIGADIFVGGCWPNKTGYLWDRHGPATQNAFPILDSANNLELLGCAENETHTMLKFRRPLETCDRQDDMRITMDTIHLIWAYQADDPTGINTFTFHNINGNKGTVSTYLLMEQTDRIVPVPKNASTIDLVHANVSIPQNSTTVYWCKVFRLPAMPKSHLVRFEPVFNPPSSIRFVHHILVYHCFYDMSLFVGIDGPCYDLDGRGSFLQPLMQMCISRWLTGWAVGGGPVAFADNMGIPVFELGQSPFVIMEIHYDNSMKVPNIVDSSGMRMFVVPPRPVEVGVITLGTSVDANTLIIPPGQKSFTVYGFCPVPCTKNLPKEGLSVLRGLLHAHTVGVAIRIRLIRNGTELPNLIADNHYDFNYQQGVQLPTPTKILPGDVLLLECTYDSSKRSGVTFGGHSTLNEMCIASLQYIPRSPNLVVCFSSPSDVTMMQGIGVAKKITSNSQNSEDAAKVDWFANRIPTGKIPVTQADLLQQSLQKGIYGYYCDAANLTQQYTMKPLPVILPKEQADLAAHLMTLSKGPPFNMIALLGLYSQIANYSTPLENVVATMDTTKLPLPDVPLKQVDDYCALLSNKTATPPPPTESPADAACRSLALFARMGMITLPAQCKVPGA